MKYLVSILLALAILALPASSLVVSPTALAYSGIPTISIASVVRNETVTIRAYNLPPSDRFDVLMNYMGTRGRNGWKVGTITTNQGGSASYTFNVPSQLEGEYQIAIRIQSTTGSGYFAYNWFYNDTSGQSGGPAPKPGTGYKGFPTFSIVRVVRNQSVTIRVNNLPPNDEFTVLMNWMGTRGRNGVAVGSIDSTTNENTFTFNIPAKFANQRQIAIRMQSPTSGYFAFNWFYNSTAGGATGGGGIPVSDNPTIKVMSVTKNESITVRYDNLQEGDEFRVWMGRAVKSGYTLYKMPALDTGNGGHMKVTYTIPSALKGFSPLVIFIESKTGPALSAFVWFNNVTY